VSDHLTEQQEWDALLASIPTDLPTRDATNRLANLLADAVQAQRPWARQRLNEAMHAGLAKSWKAHVQKQRPKVKTKNGTVKGVGGIRRAVQGRSQFVQVPLDAMSFEELSSYRAMHVSNLKTLKENATVVERLLALHEKVPTAATPADACKVLGIDPADVMAGAA
jgi:hypothetical protein